MSYLLMILVKIISIDLSKTDLKRYGGQMLLLLLLFMSSLSLADCPRNPFEKISNSRQDSVEAKNVCSKAQLSSIQLVGLVKLANHYYGVIRCGTELTYTVGLHDVVSKESLSVESISDSGIRLKGAQQFHDLKFERMEPHEK